MRIPSFRLKIALLSGILSGGPLLVAALLFWNWTYRRDLDRVDRELRNLGVEHLERVNGGDHWSRFENALRFVGGTEQPAQFILWVRQQNRELHRSEQWPAALDPQTLPELDDYEPPYEPRPGTPPPPPPRRNEPISERNPPLPRKRPTFLTHDSAGRQWRLAVMGNPYQTLVLGTDLGPLNQGMARLRTTFLALLPVVLGAVGAGAWWLSSRALRPVSQLTRSVEGITARGLDQRIVATAHDREFLRLVTVFNAMLDRLEKSFHQATRFSADAAHELRTPLTILQMDLEMALESAEAGSETQRLCVRLIEEISRLRAIQEKLLLLSQADAGKLPLQPVPVDWSRAVREAADDARSLAPHLHVQETVPDGVIAPADPILLDQILQNLTTNAVNYNEPGGAIEFELRPQPGHLELRVSNTGPGIPEEHQPRLFQRFHRGDPSRHRETGGTGLGLSLAREIARAHRGELRLDPTPGAKTTFVLTWPLQAIG
jgi:two-component system heavy metal sensor histidine kinase CusS